MLRFVYVGLIVIVSCALACSEKSGSTGAAGGTSSSGGAGGSGGMGQGGGAGEGGAMSGKFQAVHDTHCEPERVIGRFRIMGFPQTPSVSGELWDTPSPLIGPPELENSTCAFHHYQPSCGGSCNPGTICSIKGECVPERRSIKNARLEINADGGKQIVDADPMLGGFYAQLTTGTASSNFGVTLTWDDVEITLDPLAYEPGPLSNLKVMTEGVDSTPGALDATWDVQPTGYALSTIPINHHAQAGTFTFCAAPASAGAFHADAPMINPLAVITGLEFQGVEYVNVAAADTPFGCVEFRLGESQF